MTAARACLTDQHQVQLGHRHDAQNGGLAPTEGQQALEGVPSNAPQAPAGSNSLQMVQMTPWPALPDTRLHRWPLLHLQHSLWMTSYSRHTWAATAITAATLDPQQQQKQRSATGPTAAPTDVQPLHSLRGTRCTHLVARACRRGCGAHVRVGRCRRCTSARKLPCSQRAVFLQHAGPEKRTGTVPAAPAALNSSICAHAGLPIGSVQSWLLRSKCEHADDDTKHSVGQSWGICPTHI